MKNKKYFLNFYLSSIIGKPVIRMGIRYSIEKTGKDEFMDKQEEFIIPNRAEYIRIARESCNRNQSSNPNSKAKSAYRYKEMVMMDDGSMSEVISGTGAGQTNGMKIFLIRLICASLLFLAVFIMDQFKIHTKEVNISRIESQISESAGIKEAQDFFVSVLDKFR